MSHICIILLVTYIIPVCVCFVLKLLKQPVFHCVLSVLIVDTPLHCHGTIDAFASSS